MKSLNIALGILLLSGGNSVSYASEAFVYCYARQAGQKVLVVTPVVTGRDCGKFSLISIQAQYESMLAGHDFSSAGDSCQRDQNEDAMQMSRDELIKTYESSGYKIIHDSSRPCW
jgi:hypothetical protein